MKKKIRTTFRRIFCFMLCLLMLLDNRMYAEAGEGEEYECAACGYHTWIGAKSGVTYEDLFCTDCGVKMFNANDSLHDCYWKLHCSDCGVCMYADDNFCNECFKCSSCKAADGHHCHKCNKHCDNMCEQCVAVGFMVCWTCQSEHALCPGCGKCMLALWYGGIPLCEDKHCNNCDEAFICNGCGQCFYNEDKRANFCEACDYCLSCATSEQAHCAKCGECFTKKEKCSEFEELCEECCKQNGNHCKKCGEHIEGVGDWCEGGHGTSCADCHADYVCQECFECTKCNGSKLCKICGLCIECCSGKSLESGCIEGLCVESDDFLAEDHLCVQCETNFSCSSDAFCEDCGLCQECCEENAAAFDCYCGLCVETTEFEQHICDNCGEPSCEHGGICAYCGKCEDCCIAISEEAGCECGSCVEDPAWDNADHICSQCGDAFSCVVPFCEICNLCEDCCEDNTLEMGCVHYYCLEDKEWKNHFCSVCGSCKTDCDCGQKCCDTGVLQCDCCVNCTNENRCDCGCEDCIFDTTSLHNIGAILHNPSNRYGRISENDKYDKAANKVSFSVRAFTGGKNLYYQWYYRVNGGSPIALSNSSQYDSDSDETLIFTSGADSFSLNTYVPVDACSKVYTYFCVVMDENHNELSRSEEAVLSARHLYDWVATPGNETTTHSYQCISCGEAKKGRVETHVPGSWHFKQFATTEQGAILVRRCNVCRYEFETEETEALEEYHDLYHNYYYIALEYRHEDKKTKKVRYKSAEHLLQCRCSFIGSREEHTWSEWHYEKVPTTKETGEKWRQCIYCNFRETVDVPKITHEHGDQIPENWKPEDFDWKGDFEAGYDTSSHWVYCPDINCDAILYKSAHRWVPVLNDNYELFGDVGQTSGEVSVRMQCSYCKQYKVENYQDEVAYYAVVGKNTTNSVIWVQRNTDVDSTYVNLSAKVPKGYRFVRWINHTEEYYPNEALKIKESDLTNPKLKITLTDDKSLNGYDHCWWGTQSERTFPTHAIYFEAEIERIENQIRFYNPDTKQAVLLSPGQYLNTDWTVSDSYTGSYMAWYAEWAEDSYYYFEEPRYFARVELKDYNGGEIRLCSTGIPANLVVDLKGESYITDDSGIRGCIDGGYVEIFGGGYEGELVIECTPWSDDEINAAVQTFGKSVYVDRSIVIDGDATVYIQVNTPNSEKTAYGLYSPSFVKIEEDSSVSIEVKNTNANAPRGYAAVCIYAGQETEINSSMLTTLTCDAVGSEKRGLGIVAKAIELKSELDIIKVDPDYNQSMLRYPYGCSVTPDYDKHEFAIQKTGGCFELRKGYEFELALYDDEKKGIGVTVTSGQFKSDHLEYQDAMSGRLDEDFVTLYESAGVDWLIYADARDYASSVNASVGTWLSAEGQAFEFTVQARPGYYIDSENYELLANGKEIAPVAITDNGTVYHYSLTTGTEDTTIEISGARVFEEPFVSAPSPAKQTVLISDGGVSIDMILNEDSMHIVDDFLDALKRRRSLNSGEAEDYIRKTVSLQAHDEKTGKWVEINQFFDPEGENYDVSWRFKDDLYAEAGKTVAYRLTVLFDGKIYTSKEFQVTYTNDANAVKRPASKAVVYVNSETRKYVELDGMYPHLVYDVDTKQITSVTEAMYTRDKYQRYIPVGEFESITGTLSLVGDDIKNMIKGSEVKMDIAGMIAGISTLKDYPGDLVIKLMGERSTLVSDAHDFETVYSFFGEKCGNGAISNPYGKLTITNNGKNSPWLDITTTVSPEVSTVGNNEYGNRYAGIYAKNNLLLNDINLWMTNAENKAVPGFTYAMATGYGILSDESVLVNGAADLRIQFGSQLNSNYNAVCLKAGKDLVVSDNCSIDFYGNTGGLPESTAGHTVAVKQCAVEVGRDIYIQDNAEVLMQNSGSDLCVYAGGNILVNTEGSVEINANNIKSDYSTAASYALYANGDVTLKKCEKMVLKYREKDGLGGETNKTAISFPRTTYIKYLSDNSAYDMQSYAQYAPGAGNTLTVRTFDVPAIADVVNYYIESTSGERYQPNGRSIVVAAGDRVKVALPGGVLDDLPIKELQLSGIEEKDCEIDLTNNFITFTMPDNGVRINAKYADSPNVYLKRAYAAGHNIELSDCIGLNYYMRIPVLPADIFYDAEGNLKVSAKFMKDGEIVGEVKLTKDMIEDDGTYKLSCPLAASELTDELIVQLECEGIVGNLFKYSVKSYAEEILVNAEDREDFAKAQTVVKALLNYGTEAQKYFEHRAEYPANASLSAKDKEISPLTSEMLKGTDFILDAKNAEAAYKGMSLLLQDKVVLRLYFEDAEKNLIHEDIPLNAGTLGEGQTYTLHGNTFTNLSAYSYIKQAQTAEEYKKLSSLLAALYAYNEACKAYKQ